MRTRPMRFLAIALILISPIAFAPLSYAAGRVFFEDFESYSVGLLPTTQWQQDSPNALPQVVTDSLDKAFGPHSGTKMMRANWNGSSGAFETAKLTSWSYSSEFLIRLWMRYDADVDHAFGNKAFRLYPIPSGQRDSFILAAEMQPGVDGQLYYEWELIDNVTGPHYTGKGLLGDGRWHKIEIYIKHNTIGQTDGILKLWMDGSLKSNNSNLKTVQDGGHWYPMFLMSNWSTNSAAWVHDAANHVYWDDIEIFSDTGTGATGLMSDATVCVGSNCALTPPQNVRFTTP